MASGWVLMCVCILVLASTQSATAWDTQLRRNLATSWCDTKYPDPLPKHLYAVTTDDYDFPSGLYTSADGGSTWNQMTTILRAAAESDVWPASVVNIVSKSNTNAILFMNATKTLWLTHDYGATVRAIHINWAPETADFRVHPTNEDWILALVNRDPDCDDYDSKLPCTKDLLVTQNAFANELTWTNLTLATGGKLAGFVDFEWAAKLCEFGCPTDDKGNQIMVKSESILATAYKHAGDLDAEWDPDVNLVQSDDWFRSFRQLFACGDQFEVVGRSIYLAMSNLCPTDGAGNKRAPDLNYPQGISLYTSIDAGATFTQACLPDPLKQGGYQLVQTYDHGGVVVIVDYEVRSPFGRSIWMKSIYTAGPHHAIFSRSLANVQQDVRGSNPDFVAVEGVPGVYIANQRRRCWDCDDVSLTSSNIEVTRITFSGGGDWGYIPAPSSFKNRECNTCAGVTPCYLHLTGVSDGWRPSLYSNKDAPGLLMATGNVAGKGSGLDPSKGVCTWVSNDAGATWSDVFVGAYIYEWADWGSVLVAATHMHYGLAEVVQVSLNYGQCWVSIPLAYAMSVENIRIEPDGQRPKVIIHGQACRKKENPKCSLDDDTGPSVIREGLVYALDVQAVMKVPDCTRELDYETWEVPAPGGQKACLLGQRTIFTRRKPDSFCLNGPLWKRPAPQTTTCACSTQYDVECDFGYVESSAGECKPMPLNQVECCPLLADGKYTISSTGLRLVHGDNCTGLSAIIPDTDGKGTLINKKAHKHGPVPGTGSQCVREGERNGGRGGGSALAGFLIFLLVVGSLGGAFAGWWFLLATSNAKATIREAVAPVTAFFGSIYGWCADKISGSRYSRAHETGEDLGYFQPLGDSHVEPPANGRTNFTL